MRLPIITGLIDRRILLNYRVEPDVIARVLPQPFRPKLAGGFAIAGVCLIRLKQLRPRGWPAALGFSSENAAHRIAVTWEQDGQSHEGVYIPRRDTNSRWNTLVGGRLFPGEHHHARFEVSENPSHLDLRVRSDDGRVLIEVAGEVANRLPDRSVFASLDEASTFFEAGAVGYSTTGKPGRLDGLELRCRNWRVEALSIHHACSSFFEDAQTIPSGTAQLDCALLMRGVEHEWHSRGDLCCGPLPGQRVRSAAAS